MIDNELTKQIQAFMAKTGRTQEDIVQAAMLLLRINHNRALYQLIMRNPMRYEKKVEYELGKHLKYRLDGLTLQEVQRMDVEVRQKVDKLLDNGRPVSSEEMKQPFDAKDTERKLGRRVDHELLPPEIQALWDRNAERWKRIKEARATCEMLSMPCDRYEYLKFMGEAYARYKRDMQKYDEYRLDTTQAARTDNPEKAVSSARAYISKNRKKYEELAASDPDKAAALKENIQQRVDTLVKANATISAELAEWLAKFGFDGYGYGD